MSQGYRPARALLIAAALALLGLAVHRWLWTYPAVRAGDELAVDGLHAAVTVAQRPDGVWRIRAADEHDAMVAQGYLQARDRMAQLDLFRHLARGELAELLGDRPFGEKTALEVDRLNRFLGFRDQAAELYARTSAEERAALDAFARGVRSWMAEGTTTIEHRLLRAGEMRPWTPIDSLAIYLMLMHGLAGNADREVRRLLIVCAAGRDAVEQVWPTDIEFGPYALPPEDVRPDTYPPAPAVVPELAAVLPELCAQGAADTYEPAGAAPSAGAARAADGWPTDAAGALVRVFADGWSASNNWVVAGVRTASGKPILSGDPHLPHMNPPVMWGVELEYPGEHVAGFVFPGLHRVVVGHNGYVAWSPTTNHVDRQDLMVLRVRSDTRDGRRVEGYELDGEFVPFGYRTEVFHVRGAEPVRQTVRFTRDGPLLNDLEPFVARRIPLTAVRAVPPGRGGDLDGARAMNHARTLVEFGVGLARMDVGCQNWLAADARGHIGYRSPCVVPVREGWRGTFPVPGWTRRYDWRGLYDKGALPASTDPARGWLVTANSDIVPSGRFPSAYNNDAAAPNRFLRIARRIDEVTARAPLTAAASAAIELDATYDHWPALRQGLETTVCAAVHGDDAPAVAQARQLLCAWDGVMGTESPAATLYVLWTNAALDQALADVLPGGAASPVWHYVQSLLQFEAVVSWVWSQDETAPVWDDARTAPRERRADILERAFVDAVAVGVARYGSDPSTWRWGAVRPFVLTHAFAAPGSVLGWFLNSGPVAVAGDTETVFKQQFVRADRARLHAAVGPVVRFTIDMAEPWAAVYALAGGESGWPASPFNANLLEDWAAGRTRPLTPADGPDDVTVRLLPAMGRAR